MLQLRRVRLDAVGHPDARFAPLELDLTDERRRPTHTVVWLRNGGGKSSLLNLLFAVVRPHRREFLGGNDDGKDRRLGDYVLDGDTSHVCIEWGPSGARRPSLVTGMVLEWRDRTRVADESRLRRLWYAFVPGDHRDPGLLELEPTLTFDTVPRSEDGRRLSLTRFRDRLRAIAATDGSLRLVTPDSQAEWRRELEHHDLDPEVLRYQLQMNREEGGASELFKRRCRSTSDFVDLLLELAVADERTDRVADIYLRYADELARRPDIERNRDFLAGALERLEPLTGLAADQATEERRLRDVLADAASTASVLRDSAGRIRAEAGSEQARAAAARRDADAAAARETQQRDRDRALRRLAARLDVRVARERHEAAAAALAEAEAHLAAARLLEPLARRRVTDAEIAEIDARLDTDQSATAQQLRRTRAALARRLRADARASAQAAEERRGAATECHRDADVAAAEAEAATAERGRLEQSLATLRERAAAWTASRDDLRRRGVLDDDVTTALADARAGLARARAQHEQQRQLVATLDAELRATYARVSRLDEAVGDAGARRSAADHARVHLHAAASAVTDDARLRAVAESEAIDIWDTGAGLAERLDALVADADRALADAAVTAAGDRAALVALQTDGLLPPRTAVNRVVAVLRAHGIAAEPGWRYLARHVAEHERPDVIARAPAIVDGVVLADPDALEHARETLAALAEPLRSIVVAGPAPRPHPDIPPQAVAPVDPALHDHTHADRARARLQARLADADRERAALTAARDRDAALADRLRRLLADHPRARREHVEDQARLAHDEHERLRAERDRAAAEVGRIEARRATVVDPDRESEDLAALAGVVSDLEALDGARVDPAAIATLEAEIHAVRERAATAAARVAALRRTAADHLVAAQRRVDDCARLEEEIATHTSGRADDDGDDDEPAEALRRRVQVLEASADAERGDPLLDQRRRLLLQQRSEHDRVLAAAPVQARTAAAALLATLRGHDPGVRAAALDHALTARDAALEARAEAAERLRAAHDAARPSPDVDDADVSAVDDLSTPDAARTLADELTVAADRSRADVVAARARAAAADRRATQARQQADALDHLAELVTIELRARPTGAPDEERPAAGVPDDPELARAVVDEVRVRIEQHVARTDRAASAVADAADDVRRFVAADRFAALDGPIRSRLSTDPVAVARADTDLVAQLRIRLAQCAQKLDELSAHRRLLVREIAADTQRGLWLLRQADQVSALPEGFGDWSDERFLHIRFATPAVDEELIGRLEAMVERLVDDGIRPAGVPLLQRAVHAAVGPQGFTVRILKPNPALVAQRVPVTELATFSGGEQLTAAILLYCTLARLRSQARQTRAAAGVLTLDNPIGKSSNVTLLQLQRRVADAMGVQLVYTTAVDDREAVGVLPHWIRLRNERRDTRTGNLHVERSRDPGGDVGRGTVAATHLWRRNDAVAVAPGGG